MIKSSSDSIGACLYELLDIRTYGNKSIYHLLVSQSALLVSKTDLPKLRLMSGIDS